MATEHLWERVAGEHSALTGSTACDYEISSAGVQQDSGKNTVLDICKLMLILCGVHTIIEYGVSHRLYH